MLGQVSLARDLAHPLSLRKKSNFTKVSVRSQKGSAAYAETLLQARSLSCVSRHAVLLCVPNANQSPRKKNKNKNNKKKEGTRTAAGYFVWLLLSYLTRPVDSTAKAWKYLQCCTSQGRGVGPWPSARTTARSMETLCVITQRVLQGKLGQ